MKTIKISRDSWHWQLLDRLDWGVRYTRDFCQYCRYLIWAIICLVIMYGAGGLVVWAYLDAALWFVAEMQYGTIINNGSPIHGGQLAIGLTTLALVIMAVCVVVIFGFPAAGRAITKIPTPRVPQEGIEFLEAAYESWKERMCFRVELTSGKPDRKIENEAWD